MEVSSLCNSNMKKKQVKKEKVKHEVVAEEAEIVTLPGGVKEKISLVTADFSREDLNELRDKVNQLIEVANAVQE